jgi:hypothetical protein
MNELHWTILLAAFCGGFCGGFIGVMSAFLVLWLHDKWGG